MSAIVTFIPAPSSGDAQADARGAAGDEGGLAFQILHATLRVPVISRWRFLYMLLTNFQVDSTGDRAGRGRRG
jgi:hypothetical protein